MYNADIMEVDKKCSVCLHKDTVLVNTWTTDDNYIKWSDKLKLFVPEVNWHEDLLICKNCINQLDSAYAFRDLCLRSFAIQKNFNNPKEVQNDANEYYEIDFKCQDLNSTECSRISDGDDLESVVVNSECSKLAILKNTEPEENNIYTFKCYNCRELFKTKSILTTHLSSCKFFERSIGLQKSSNSYSTIKNKRIIEGDTSLHVDNDAQDCAHNESSKLSDVPVKKTSTTRKTKKRKTKPDPDATTCPKCGMVFSTKYLVKRHVRNVHATEKKHQCDMCEQKFTSSVYLNAHKRYHFGERPHICSYCGKRFITGSDLYHHEKIHANKRAYKCEKCSKAFNTSSDLHKHKMCVHLDRSHWKYVCNFCERRFPLKTNLDAHTKTHTGERNFECHLCDRKCVNNSILMRHIQSHSNICLYRCSLCVLEYKYEKSLNIHLKKAHGVGDAKVPVKRFFCHICPKSYFANNKLQKHIRTHTGERPFSCQLCDKRFLDKSYVAKHLLTVHNVSSAKVDA